MNDQLQSPAAKTILDGLTTPIEPIVRSSDYHAGMWGAALVMIFMVMSYVGGLAILFWILLNIAFYISSFGSMFGPSIFGVLFYGLIFLIGVSVFLALIKPLFLKRESEFNEFELQPAQEPLLFEFVHRICKAVGSPSPDQIVVDAHANAGASFVSGPLDNRMKLMIGLPLVLSLDTRQVAGIVAHEFGHFSQTSGMRLTYLVRSIDQWFTEAATNEDAWDNKIASLVQSTPTPIDWIFLLVQLAVLCARLFLLLLIKLGHFFVARLMRQMEFDADRHEARLAGSQNFAKTARSLRILELCQQKTLGDLDHYRRMDQLPDNLPALLVDNESQVDLEKFRELEVKLLEIKTEWGDSHPSDRDRIENAARENTQGTFTVEYPARVLFSDTDAVCRAVTMETYRSVFGAEFNPAKVKETAGLLAARKVRQTEGEAALRFALEQFCGYDTFLLPRSQLGTAVNSSTYQTQTHQRREQLLSHVRGYAKIRQEEDKVWEDMAAATCAKRLIEAGFDLAQAGDTFEVRTIQQAVKKINRLKTRDHELKSRLKPFRHVLGQRLIDALEFMRSDKIVGPSGEPADVVDEIKLILNVWNCVVELRATFESFFFETRVTAMLLVAAENCMDDQTMRSVNAALSRLTNAMIQIQQSTTDLMYPFEHGLGQISLSHFLVPKLPTTQDIVATMDAAADMDKNLEFLLKRCVARLGSLAEKVETAFGLEPLETPAEVKKMADED